MPTSPRRRDLLRAGGTAGIAALAGCSLPSFLRPRESEKVDDWQFDPDTVESGGGGFLSRVFGGASLGASTQAGSANYASLGMAAGGAKDVENFRRNVEEGYLPLPTDMSYEGLFYDYYFETGAAGDCSETFCPQPAAAIAPDPLSGETEFYATVGLESGLSAADFDRKPLDLVVVLDISGSMDSPFSSYHYDRNDPGTTPAGNGTAEESRTPTSTPPEDAAKMSIASEAIADMTTHLRDGDRFGMVVFNNDSYVAKPMRAVEETDMDAIRGHIRELKAGGGTRLSGGLDDAADLLEPYADVDRAERETRMVVATDAMPNLGRTGEGQLLETLEDNADAGIYSTFVGIGVDFNSEIVHAITSVEGANYFSVHDADEFERRMADQFEFWVTPLVFDLSVVLDSDAFDLASVYGSTDAEAATDTLMHVNTLFPSPQRDGKAKGGVVLARLTPVDRGDNSGTDASLAADWEHRDGSTGNATGAATYPDADEHYAHSGIRKAVLLSRYASMIQNWTIYERQGTTGGADATGGIDDPPEFDSDEDWERQSAELTVSAAYRDRFALFADHFAREIDAIGDDSLQQELEILRELADYEG